jgi:fatty-acid desaturase
VSCAAGARDAQVEDLDVLSSVLSVFVWTQSWRLCQEMADGCDTLWGMQAVRAVWVYHITWFVNSASHVWGTQVWNTGDLSRNNWWVALLAFGEGWHNNHHAFEYSARHGLEWWQLDPTWWVVRGLEVVGLATKVKLPRQEHMERLAIKSS